MEKAVADYLRDKKDLLPSLYDWEFDDLQTSEDFEISFKGQSWFEKTLELKDGLRARVRTTTNSDEHARIATYFIKDWGGITRFSKVAETLALFSEYQGQSSLPTSFRPSLQRVSSWSKWASIACYEWACIYDARVAYSLNAINYLQETGCPIFPIPDGRNSRLKMLDITTLLLNERLEKGESSDPKSIRKRHFLPERETYTRYLSIVRSVSSQLWDAPDHIHEVEMLLFSLADSQIYQDVFDRISQA